MEWATPLIEGTLIQRYKRFLADVTLDDGSVITAHCPNTGAMTGCKTPGSRVLLSPADNPARKLKYTWEAVAVGDTWVGINTARPNHIVEEAIAAGEIAELSGYSTIHREVKYGEGSRIDLLLEGDSPPCYVEIKNTTLADGPLARFPDAVTSRGKKHMEELARMVRQGARAAVVFLVHRDDCDRFSPADDVDPDYGAALRDAARTGVMTLAYRARITHQGTRVHGAVPVKL
ncbi:MAG: DNA/RNA nuclease SfsA [Leptospirillia bacterium]